MTGKDLLAVLAMIVPGILLTALMAFTLVPPSIMQPFPGSGAKRGDSHMQPGTQKSLALRQDSAVAEPAMATQKRMRNPWEKPPYAKSASTR